MPYFGTVNSGGRKKKLIADLHFNITPKLQLERAESIQDGLRLWTHVYLQSCRKHTHIILIIKVLSLSTGIPFYQLILRLVICYCLCHMECIFLMGAIRSIRLSQDIVMSLRYNVLFLCESLCNLLCYTWLLKHSSIKAYLNGF